MIDKNHAGQPLGNVRLVNTAQLTRLMSDPGAKGLTGEQAFFVCQLSRHLRKAMLSELRRGWSFNDACDRVGLGGAK